MEKIRISIQEIESLQKRMTEINEPNLSDIEFTDNGEIVEIDPKILSDYKFTGLNNMDFINSGFYKTGFDIEIDVQNDN